MEMTHNDAQSGHAQVENVMQQRLATITASHKIPDGTQVKFLKTDSGKITLEYDDKPKLELVRDHGVERDG